MELYPDKIKGFISIDSAPLKKSYISAMEIWLLERVEPLYRIYPWKALLRAGSRGCAETDYGQKLMRKMMMSYDSDPKEYALHFIVSGNGMGDFISGIIAFISVLVILIGTYMTSSGIKNCK